MTLVTALGFLLILIGLWALLTRRDLIKMIIGFSIMDTGVHLVIVSLGYIKDRTAPIVDASQRGVDPAAAMVDPIPSALVLTAIVIGLAVTALMLSYAIRISRSRGTTTISAPP